LRILDKNTQDEIWEELNIYELYETLRVIYIHNGIVQVYNDNIFYGNPLNKGFFSITISEFKNAYPRRS
jgi:hypothetical protein